MKMDNPINEKNWTKSWTWLTIAAIACFLAASMVWYLYSQLK